jgi:hypothetical protein
MGVGAVRLNKSGEIVRGRPRIFRIRFDVLVIDGPDDILTVRKEIMNSLNGIYGCGFVGDPVTIVGKSQSRSCSACHEIGGAADRALIPGDA